MTPPPISRDGLARCPSCLAHVAVAADPQATVCPFCGGSFAAPTPTISRAGSSALVAALGLSLAVAGCNSKADPNDDPRSSTDRGRTEAPADRDRTKAPPTIQPAVYGGPPRGELRPEPTPMPVDPDKLRDDGSDEGGPEDGGPDQERTPEADDESSAAPPPPGEQERKKDDRSGSRTAPQAEPPATGPPDMVHTSAYGGPPTRVSPVAPAPRPPPTDPPADKTDDPAPSSPPTEGGAKADPPRPDPVEIVPLYGVAPF